MQQCVFENNLKNIVIDLHLSTFLLAKDLKEHTTISDDFEDIKFQCKSQLQQFSDSHLSFQQLLKNQIVIAKF